MAVSFDCGGIVDVSVALLVGHTPTAAVAAPCPSSSDASLSLRSGVLLHAFLERQEVSTGRVRILSKVMMLAGGPLPTPPRPLAFFLFLSVPFLRAGRRIFMAGVMLRSKTYVANMALEF